MTSSTRPLSSPSRLLDTATAKARRLLFSLSTDQNRKPENNIDGDKPATTYNPRLRTPPCSARLGHLCKVACFGHGFVGYTNVVEGTSVDCVAPPVDEKQNRTSATAPSWEVTRGGIKREGGREGATHHVIPVEKEHSQTASTTVSNLCSCLKASSSHSRQARKFSTEGLTNTSLRQAQRQENEHCADDCSRVECCRKKVAEARPNAEAAAAEDEFCSEEPAKEGKEGSERQKASSRKECGGKASRKMKPNRNQLEYCTMRCRQLSALFPTPACERRSGEALTLIPVAGGILIAPLSATGRLTQRTQLFGHRFAIIQVRMGPTTPINRPQSRGL